MTLCLLLLYTGYEATLFLTTSGNVYKCDENEDGTSTTPTLIKQDIKEITIGSYHINMIDINGNLAVGHNQFKDFFNRNKIKLKYITAGSGHTLGVSEDDKCYAFGVNESGQCGFGAIADDNPHMIVGPVLILDGEPMKRVSAGSYHNLVLSQRNRLYCWGFNGQMQCSPTWSDEDFIPYPKELDKVKDLGLNKHTYIEEAIAFYRESMIVINPNKILNVAKVR